jgi:hypothetical protein
MSNPVRLTVVIDDDQTKKAFKLLCAIQGQSMKDVVLKLIEKEIATNKAKLDSIK